MCESIYQKNYPYDDDIIFYSQPVLSLMARTP